MIFFHAQLQLIIGLRIHSILSGFCSGSCSCRGSPLKDQTAEAEANVLARVTLRLSVHWAISQHWFRKEFERDAPNHSEDVFHETSYESAESCLTLKSSLTRFEFTSTTDNYNNRLGKMLISDPSKTLEKRRRKSCRAKTNRDHLHQTLDFH